MLSNSVGEFGTLRIIIRRPSVDPIPIDASDRTELASENIRPDPLSLKMYEPVRAIDAGGDITSGLENAMPWSCNGYWAGKFKIKNHDIYFLQNSLL